MLAVRYFSLNIRKCYTPYFILILYSNIAYIWIESTAGKISRLSQIYIMSLQWCIYATGPIKISEHILIEYILFLFCYYTYILYDIILYYMYINANYKAKYSQFAYAIQKEVCIQIILYNVKKKTLILIHLQRDFGRFFLFCEYIEKKVLPLLIFLLCIRLKYNYISNHKTFLFFSLIKCIKWFGTYREHVPTRVYVCDVCDGKKIKYFKYFKFNLNFIWSFLLAFDVYFFQWRINCSKANEELIFFFAY